MNRNRYRLVFSQELGALVPVAEWVVSRSSVDSAMGETRGESHGVGETVGTAKLMTWAVMIALLVPLGMPNSVSAQTLPIGGQIGVGAGSVSQMGNTMTVNQASQKLGINWQSFNVGAGNTVNFVQPNANAIALNRVVGENRSEIYGAINANGKVFLINQHGVLFGKTAEVNVGALLATTKNITDEDFLADRFNFASSSIGEVINQGNLRADNGSIVLAGTIVKNDGTIATANGRTTLAAGEKVSLSLDASGQIAVAVTQSQLNALVENKGLIAANNGGVYLTARGKDSLTANAINMEGLITAKSGTVVLDGGNSGVVQVNNGKLDVSNAKGKGGAVVLSGQYVGVLNGSTIDASGTDGGGRVIIGGDQLNKVTDIMPNVRLAERTIFDSSSNINIGSIDGDGGFVETSGHKVNIDGNILAAAKGKVGNWLIDPDDVVICSTGGGLIGNAFSGTGASTVSCTSIGTGLSTANVTISGTSTGDINIAASVVGTGRSLILNSGGGIYGTGNLSGGMSVVFNTAGTAAGSYSGVFSGAGNFTKLGAGTVTLSGTNTYTGRTEAIGGTLVVSGSHTGGTQYSVQNGATMNISGNVVLAATGDLLVGVGTSDTYGNKTSTLNINSGGNLTVQGGFVGIGGKAGTGPSAMAAASGNLVIGSGGTMIVGTGGTSATVSPTATSEFYLSPFAASAPTTSTLTIAGTLITNRSISGSGGLSTVYGDGGTIKVNTSLTNVFGSQLNPIQLRNGGLTVDTNGFNVAIGSSNRFVHSTVGGDNAIDGGLTKTGLGTFTLNGGTNNFTGTLNVAQGTLDLTTFGANVGSLSGAGNVTGTSTTLIVGNSNQSATFSGQLQNSLYLTKMGTGTQTLAGTSNYTGGTTAIGGTLVVSGNHTGGQVYSVQNGATMNISGNVVLASNGDLLVGVGTSDTYGNKTSTLNINSGGNLTVQGGFVGIGGKAGTGPSANAAASGNLVIGSGGTMIVGTGGSSATVSPAATSEFYLSPFAASTPTTSTLTIAGTLITNRSISGSGGFSTVYGDGGTIKVNTALTNVFGSQLNPIQLRNGGLTVDTNGFNVAIGSTNRFVHSTVGGDNAIDGGLTKTGLGTFTLNGGTSNFTGTLNVAQGMLDLTTFGANVGALSGAGNITGTSNTLITGSNNLNTTFSGQIQSGLNLTKIGTGTQTLSGTNNYTGITRINAGALQLGDNGTSGSILNTSSIVNNGTLIFNRSDVVIFSQVVTGIGGVAQAGTGTTIFNATNTYSGTTNISAGTLQVGNNGTIGTLGTGDVTNSANLTYNRSDVVNITNNISGSGTLQALSGGNVSIQQNVSQGNVTLMAGKNTAAGITTGGDVAISAGKVVNASTVSLFSGNASALDTKTNYQGGKIQINGVNATAATTEKWYNASASDMNQAASGKLNVLYRYKTTGNMTYTLAQTTKTYDGTAKFNVTGINSTIVLVDGDVLDASGTVLANITHVGTGYVSNGSAPLLNITAPTATAEVVHGYDVNSVSAPITITARNITVSVNTSQGKTYGQDDTAIGYTWEGFNATSQTGLVSGDSVTGNIGRASGENFGFYNYTNGSVLAGNADYNLVLNTSGNANNFSITKANLTGSIANQTKIYGNDDVALPNISVNLTGVINRGVYSYNSTGDWVATAIDDTAATSVSANLSGLTREAGENVGNRNITAGTVNSTLAGTSAGNYQINTTLNVGAAGSTVLNITQRTITASNVAANSKTYDGTTTATVDTSNATFDAVNRSNVYTWSGNVSINDTGNVTVNASAVTGVFNTSHAGTNLSVSLSNIAISGNASGNYNASSSTATTSASIYQRNISINSTAASKTYGQSDNITHFGSGYTYANASYDGGGNLTSNDGRLTGDSITGNMGREIGEGARNYNYTNGSLHVGNTSFNDYNIVFDGVTNNYTINRANITVSANASSKTYGADDSKFNYTASGLVNNTTVGYFDANGSWKTDGIANATLTGNLGRAVGETVGNYAMTQGELSNTSLNANYNITGFTTADLTINRANITVTANASNKTYGADDSKFNYTASGLVSRTNVSYYDSNGTLQNTGVANATLTGNLGRAVGETVGNYAMTQGELSNASLNANYNITGFTTADLTINRANITVTANASNKTYGADDSKFNYSASGLVSRTNVSYYDSNGTLQNTGVANATLTGNLGRAVGETVGNYAMTQGELANTSLNANYNISFTAADLTINRANITVTANASNKTYGADDSKFNYTASGLVSRTNVSYYDSNGTLQNTGVANATLTGNLGRAVGETVGNYAMTQGELSNASLNANYNITGFTTADLTINRANITVTANASNKTYGADDSKFNYTASGLVSRTNVSYYDSNGTLQNTGVANATLTGNLGRAVGETVGNYAMTQGELSNASLNANYNITGFTTADLTINRANITVTANASNKTYGADDSKFNYSASGLVSRTNVSYYDSNGTLQNTGVANATLTGNLGRAVGEAVGNYAMTQGELSNTSLNANYNISFTAADLTINRANITVTANASNKTYGADDSKFNYSASGLVSRTNVNYYDSNGTLQNTGVANATLTGNLGRAVGETVGNYAMTQGELSNASLNANYNITGFTTADLTINRANITVTANASNKTYGADDSKFNYTASGLVSRTNVSYYDSNGTLQNTGVANATLTGNLGRAVGETVGNYAMTQGELSNASLNANYNITGFTAADLTINKANVTVTANASNKTYGSDDGVLGYMHDWTNKRAWGITTARERI